MKTLRELWVYFRVMLDLGGPLGVFIYLNDGSLDRRLAAALRNRRRSVGSVEA